MSRDTLISLIDPDPDQPRKVFDEVALAELAESIAANGLAVPILLRPAPEGRYIIVHGERRYRAAQRLGWSSIPAEVRELTPDEAHWISLVENVQRADLSPIEEARAYHVRLGQGSTQEPLAKRLGKDRTYIASKIRLLKLPEEVQAALATETLSEGLAKQLLRLRDAETQAMLCARAITGQWTVLRLKQQVDTALCPTGAFPATAAAFVGWLFEQNGRVPAHDPYPEEELPERFAPSIAVMRLPLSAIECLSVDLRTRRDPAYTAWLAEIFPTLPPIAVFRQHSRYILADGRYRIMAAELLGLQDIECRIYAGDERAAMLYGIRAGATGGAGYTAKDWEYSRRRVQAISLLPAEPQP